MDGSDNLLAGASNYGLATPGQNTGISLIQITILILTIVPTYHRLMVATAIERFLDELCNGFYEIEKEIEDEEEELNGLG
jgi:hypothetical protein